MKKLIIVLFAFILVKVEAQDVKPFPKTITVTGSAEMEIVPDEIYVQVDLKEYQRKGDKTSIDKIKTDFLNNLKAIGIPDSLISIAAYEGENGNANQWWKKKKSKDDDLLASIAYQIKLNSSAQVDKLVNVLDDEATSNFQVIRTSHSRINEFRKQLKIQAIKAAREKAFYLADAINEKVGEAITINEPNENILPYYGRASFANSNTISTGFDNGDFNQGTVDFKKMKLKFEVTTVFSLK